MVQRWKKRFAALGMGLLLGAAAIGTAGQADVTYAHSGRTDGQGGHKDNKNKSGLGGYHYHCGGYPAHLHDGGVCPYTSGASETVQESVPQEKISVTQSPSVLVIGESGGFDYSIENGSDSAVTVSSSDSSVIQVNPDNSLSAVGAGSATISVKSANASTSFSVTVNAVQAESITIAADSEELRIAETSKLSANILPENTSDKTITWRSSNEEIVSVGEDGTIIANAVGDAQITAAAANGVEASVTVKVLAPVPEEININPDKIRVCVNESMKMEIKILPENTENKEYTIKCADEDIALVTSDGMLQALSEGDTKLVLSTWNGIEKEVPVEVYHIPVEEIQIDDSKLNYKTEGKIDKAETIQLSAMVLPENATYPEIIWTSSDDDIVEVVDGEFKVHKTGEVTITATVADGIKAEINLEVVGASSGLLSGTVLLVGAGLGGGLLYQRRKKAKS